MKTRLVLLLILLVSTARPQITPQQEKELFSRIDEMFSQVSEILGMKILRPVPRAVITRDKIRDYIERRMGEALKPGELRAQELVLKKFGFLPSDYDLKSQMVDLLTEQAAAFYDFKQKKLYLSSWIPPGMQDMALVHELAHALADQHFNLEKFIEKSGDDDDAATARGAVVEGQASWVMTEYLARQIGQSLRTSPQLAHSAIAASAQAAKEFPVFGAAPLYLRETLLFPYTQGMLFQQAVYEKQGRAAFAEVFRRAPATSQQVIHAEKYFSRAPASKPGLPAAPPGPGFKKLMAGTIGQLDLQILIEQSVGEKEARELGPRWKGGRYALWENPKTRRSVLYYSVEWESEADASRYWDLYQKICAQKWKQLRVAVEQPGERTGAGDDGRFTWTLKGTTFTAIEGREE